MCGIAGFYDSRGAYSSQKRGHILSEMLGTLHHRGPDGQGQWVDKQSGATIGHCRLSIIDLTNAGFQPMVSASERYVLSFNGEIYNFKDIRATLEQQGSQFRGRSDTEVLLTAIEHWGITACLQKIDGMFAIALWDRQERSFTFARDRFGKKPLYVGWAGNDFIFSSELKSFHKHPDFTPVISAVGRDIYDHYGYIHAPHTIFDGVSQLKPASFMVLTEQDLSAPIDLDPKMITYWSLSDIDRHQNTDICEYNDVHVLKTFEARLEKAVADRMISDVPLGAFLSGGIDSSTVVAMMQRQSMKPIKSFTIGFEEQAYNEAVYAKEIAAHLGTDHHEFYVSSTEAMQVIPSLPDMYDEPFADSSQVPTFLVSKMARDHVTVVLTGDGGDEILAGYDRHVKIAPIWEKIKFLPHSLRQVLFGLLQAIPDPVYAMANRRNPHFAARVKRSLSLFQQKDIKALYDALTMMRPAASKGNDAIMNDNHWSDCPWPKALDALHFMLYGDMVMYRPYDLMTKADRATMATSLEARSPLMDHHLAEICWSLPRHYKIRGGQGKWLLRQVLQQYVPSNLFDRPKMGFSVPLDQWLKTDLKGWADELLTHERLENAGYTNISDIHQQWQQFQSTKTVQEVPKYLWSVFMYQAWYDKWMKGTT